MRLETYSKFMVLALSKPYVIPWKLRNKWDNCTRVLHCITLLVTHIYNKENHYAKRVTNLDLINTNYIWWNDELINKKTNYGFLSLKFSRFKILTLISSLLYLVFFYIVLSPILIKKIIKIKLNSFPKLLNFKF